MEFFNWSTIKHFYAFIIILIFAIIAFLYKKTLRNQKTSIFNQKISDKHKLLKYLDTYFISNIYMTLFAVFSYFIGHISIIIFFRYSYKNTMETPFPLDNDLIKVRLTYTNFFSIIVYIIFFILCVVLIRYSLNALFYKEVQKFHFFLRKNPFYTSYFCHEFYETRIHDVLGKIYLFFFNISNLNAISPSFIEKYSFDDYMEFIITNYNNNNTKSYEDGYQEFNLYDTIYENKNVIYLAISLTNICKKYNIFHIIIKVLTLICKFCYYNLSVNNFAGKIPYIIYFYLLFLDSLSLTVYYSYYGFFLFYIYLIFYSISKFYHKLDLITDAHISKYFYSNETSYNTQRKNIINYLSLPSTKQNNNLLDRIKQPNVIKYLLNDFVDPDSTPSIDYGILMKKYNSMMKRYAVVMFHMLLLIYVLCNKNMYKIKIGFTMFNINLSFIYILILLIMILIYITINIYKSLPKNHSNELSEYKYNKKFHIFYWIINITLFVIYYFIFVKPTLFIISDGLLFESSVVSLTYQYTFEDKLIFFYYYLDYYLNNNFHPEDVKRIMTFISELDMRHIIDDITTVKDLKIYINEISLAYMDHVERIINLFLDIEKEHRELIAQRLRVKNYMDFITNTINFICFYKYFTTYVRLWHIVFNPHSIKTIYYVKKLVYLIWCISKK